jgi:hypothetical protein
MNSDMSTEKTPLVSVSIKLEKSGVENALCIEKSNSKHLC